MLVQAEHQRRVIVTMTSLVCRASVEAHLPSESTFTCTLTPDHMLLLLLVVVAFELLAGIPCNSK